MISPVIGLAWLAWRFQAGVNAIAGKHAAPANIELLPARFDDQPAFARHSDNLEQLGFSPIGNYEVRAVGQNAQQRTFLRAFLAPDRSAWAVTYELVSLTTVPGARAGAQKVWAEIVSRRSEAESLTTSNGEPPLALLDENPDRPVQRFPGASVAKLWDEHRRALGASYSELTAAEFAPRFTQAWTRAFEFHESRGLYQRAGDKFVATSKLGRRSALEFHFMLRHRTGMRYALLVMAAVLAGSLAVDAADGLHRPFAVPLAAALLGAIFAVLFRHFELPAVLMICGFTLALDRDDGLAIAAFLLVLIQGAVILQRRRAARASARLAG